MRYMWPAILSHSGIFLKTQPVLLKCLSLPINMKNSNKLDVEEVSFSAIVLRNTSFPEFSGLHKDVTKNVTFRFLHLFLYNAVSFS
ncbi:hypothetical protein X975_25938, partial [Stegodyphus mimosarum]